MTGEEESGEDWRERASGDVGNGEKRRTEKRRHRKEEKREGRKERRRREEEKIPSGQIELPP